MNNTKDTVKRIILLHVPLSICNFRCHYCYLTHRSEYYQNIQPKMEYSPEHVARALSAERLGGFAFINICADGETLLTKNIELYIEELAKQGHYIEIVTNLTVSSVIDKILSFDEGVLNRVTFKCSFHYLQLKEKGLLDVFAENANKIWNAGVSANIEVTPSDELIPFIGELKEFSMKHFGALPHLTIARDDRTKGIEYLTELSVEEYDKTWSQFNSKFWEFKKEIFKKKRKEFCYAGDWLLYVNLSTGETTQCYKTNIKQNIFKDIEKPIDFMAVGKCNDAHCYNGHALLTLGCIPNFTDVGYGDIRNRVRVDGREWIQPQMKDFLNSHLCESNCEYGFLEKQNIKMGIFKRMLIKSAKNCIIKIVGRNKVIKFKKLIKR